MAAKRKPFSRKKFSPPDSAELNYASSLKKIASVVGATVSKYFKGLDDFDYKKMNTELKKYSKILEPFARKKAQEFINAIDKKNETSWAKTSRLINKELKKTINEKAVGAEAKRLVDEQVKLIKSIPIEAGRRAQALAMRAIETGQRAEQTAQMIMETEGVTKSRAVLIARTETAKANAALTKSRALAVGVTRYIWETADDADVRESHAEMEGRVFEFENPPTLSDGMTGNPGDFPNCRCFASPIIEN